jgi:O-antigen/teichoic acid export membrane protein
MAYLARTLGVERFGFIGFVSSISAYVILFANFGIENSSTQQLSSDRGLVSRRTIGTIIGTRSLLSIIFIIPFIVFGFYYSQTMSEKLFFVFQSIVIFAYSFNLQYYFVAVREVKTLAFIRTGSAFLILAATYCFIMGPSDLQYVALVSGCVTLLFYLWSVRHVFKELGGAFSIPTFVDMKTLVRRSFPLGVSALMIQIYFSADIVFLGFTNPGVQLGYYTGAYRIINLISAVPALIYLTYVPDLAKITEGHSISKATREYIAVVIGSGVVIVGICFYFSRNIISLILGAQFAPSRTVFQILLLNALLIYINVAVAHLLMAWGEHRSYLLVVSSGAAVNIVLNFVLIPLYGINGAAVATVCAEAAVCVAAWYHLRKKFHFSIAKVIHLR